MSAISLRQRLRYKFDNFMSKGGSSIFISLLVVFLSTLTLISILRCVLLYFAPAADVQNGSNIWTNVYVAFLQMTAPGNMNQDVRSAGWFKIPAILSGLAGVIMLSSLVAIITTALDRKLTQLRKGLSLIHI